MYFRQHHDYYCKEMGDRTVLSLRQNCFTFDSQFYGLDLEFLDCGAAALSMSLFHIFINIRDYTLSCPFQYQLTSY